MLIKQNKNHSSLEFQKLILGEISNNFIKSLTRWR